MSGRPDYLRLSIGRTWCCLVAAVSVNASVRLGILLAHTKDWPGIWPLDAVFFGLGFCLVQFVIWRKTWWWGKDPDR